MTLAATTTLLSITVMTSHEEPPQTAPSSTPPLSWWLFGDAAALVLISALSAATMALSHAVANSSWLAVVVGMIAAMAVQMALAFAGSLVLGSIETQVPAMLGGMLAPMAVCLVSPVTHLTVSQGALVGMAAGLVLVIWLDRYRRSCIRNAVRSGVGP